MDEKQVKENNQAAETKEQSNENKRVQKKSKRDMNGAIGGIVFGAASLLAAYKIYSMLKEFPVGALIAYAFGLFGFLCVAISISCFFDYKESKKRENLEEEALREEKELSMIEPAERALRAEKLFRVNQKELMRYYDMNLAQTKFLSGLGIIMIAFGIIIVAASLYMYMSLEADRVLLFVGSLSGIVVDFIGAIFIKMYTQNIEAAVKFHAKFADCNNLLLANSIANKIEDDVKREETLSEISKSIISMKNS